MTLFAVVSKNLRHRSTRSVLTIVGVALGMASVVMITSLVHGIDDAWSRVYTARGTDLIVMKGGHLNPAPPLFDEAEASRIAAVPGVSQIGAALSEIASIEDAPIVLVFGWQPSSFLWDHVTLVEGRFPTDAAERSVVLGTVAADMLGKHVGQSVEIDGDSFVICGVFRSGSLAENGAVVMTLPQLQRVSDQAGKLDYLNVKVDSGADRARVDAVRQAIVRQLPGFKAFTAGEVASNNSALQAGAALSAAVSVVALFIGAVCVANTMLMSVFERVHEFGILLAIGWRRRRIVRMVIFEALVLAVTGGVVGMAVGLIGLKALQASSLLSGKVAGVVDPAVLGMAFLFSLALGVAGGIYPAYRTTGLQPSATLRWE